MYIPYYFAKVGHLTFFFYYLYVENDGYNQEIAGCATGHFR